MGDAEADPEGLVEGDMGPPEEGSGRGLGRSAEEKVNFSLEIACFGEFWAIFSDNPWGNLH